MTIKKYEATDTDFVNTSEAYSKNLFFANNGTVVIPYVNIGLMPDNPINGKQAVVDFSYYMITGVKSMLFAGSKDRISLDFNLNVHTGPITEHIMVGGYKGDNGAEATIICEGLFYFFPEGAKISDPLHPFTPTNTPRFNINMDEEEVDNFFKFHNLPKEIKEILGDKTLTIGGW